MLIWHERTRRARRLVLIITKGIPPRWRHEQVRSHAPADGVVGIDFWHAVEFSRCGRTLDRVSQPSPGQPYYLSRQIRPVKPTGSASPAPLPCRTDETPLRSWRLVWESRPRTVHLLVSVAPNRCDMGTLRSGERGVKSDLPAPDRPAGGFVRRSLTSTNSAM